MIIFCSWLRALLIFLEVTSMHIMASLGLYNYDSSSVKMNSLGPEERNRIVDEFLKYKYPAPPVTVSVPLYQKPTIHIRTV